MDIRINQQAFSLPDEATVADALAAFGATPPFAVALNGDFVARPRHQSQRLTPGDALEIVRPVVGG